MILYANVNLKRIEIAKCDSLSLSFPLNKTNIFAIYFTINIFINLVFPDIV